MRTRAWHATALLRLSHGDRRGANAAIAAGLRALEAHRMTLGATELRAHASGHGEELATLGLRLAVESGSAARVLAAAERRRAAGLLLRPARPPDDAELAAELAELRRVTAALDESLRDGRPDAALSAARRPSSARSAAARCAPAAIPRQSRNAYPRSAALTAALGERVLVEYFALDGRLHAVTVVEGRARLHALGRADEIDREVASLRFSLRSLATARPGSRAADVDGRRVRDRRGPARRAAARTAPHRPNAARARADRRAARAAVVDAPVARAPAARGRSVAAALVPRREPRAPPRPRAVLVAGPRLPAATEEIETLRARHPDALALTGATRPSRNVAQALDGADSAHVAAHGRFRDDNPLFCSLELADGALTVYDLERLRTRPAPAGALQLRVRASRPCTRATS